MAHLSSAGLELDLALSYFHLALLYLHQANLQTLVLLGIFDENYFITNAALHFPCLP